MGDNEPAEQADPVPESPKVSTSGTEPLVPAAAPQEVAYARCDETYLTMASVVVHGTSCRRTVALWSS